MSAPRALGLTSLLALGVNGIVGVGIFFAPADVAARAPGALGVGIFAGVALALAPLALTFATLGARFDEDGGPVVYARAAFGERASFAVGWIAYVSALASTAAVVSGLAHAIFGDRAIAAIALACALAALVAAGLSLTARVWTAVTAAKLLPLVALVVASLVSTASVAASAGPAASTAGLAAAALVVTFAYQGFEIVPVVAGAARSSSRTVPAAVVLSLVACAGLYVLLQRACVRGVVDLASSPSPLVSAARFFGGPILARVVEAGTTISALGISIGMMAMTPRYLSSLAVNARLGLGLGEQDARGVPRRALAVTLTLVLTLVASGSRGELFALSSVAVLSQYAVTSVALIALARRRARGLGARHAWLGVPGVLVAGAIATGASRREWIAAGIALLLGVVVRAATERPSPSATT